MECSFLAIRLFGILWVNAELNGLLLVTVYTVDLYIVYLVNDLGSEIR